MSLDHNFDAPPSEIERLQNQLSQTEFRLNERIDKIYYGMYPMAGLLIYIAYKLS